MLSDFLTNLEAGPAAIEGIRAAQLKVPFDKKRTSLVSSLADRLLQFEPRQPSFVALGWWLRSSSMEAMQSDFEELERLERSKRFPMGLVLTIAPNNVDLMFGYTWALNFLLGNNQVVRVSSRASELETLFIRLLTEVLGDELSRSTVFFSGSHNNPILQELFRISDSVLVWGSNKTVRDLERYERSVNSRYISFPHRESSALIDSQEFLKLEGAGLSKLLDNFQKDTKTFSQQACSSPRKIFWLGPDAHEAISRFVELSSTGEGVPDEVLSAKRTMESTLIMMGAKPVRDLYPGGETTHLVATSRQQVRLASELNPGFDSQVHIEIQSVEALQEFLDSDEQSLVIYGNVRSDVLTTLNSKKYLPRRVVRGGSALIFDYRWDGRNLLAELTKPVFRV